MYPSPTEWASTASSASATTPRQGRINSTLLWWSIAAIAVAGSFVLQYRFIINHFSNGPYLLDAGWQAYLMSSGNYLLTDPKVIDEISWYNWHISPYLSLLTIIFHSFGLTSAAAFALHQGITFSIITGCLCYLAVSRANGASRILQLAAAITLSLTGNVVLQIASYPHYEIAMPAFGLLGLVLLLQGYVLPAFIALGLCVTAREDGGFYAAYAVFASAVVGGRLPLRARDAIKSRSFWLTVALAALSCTAFLTKRLFFNRVSVFNMDFVGDGWSHVTAWFLFDRLAGVLRQMQYLVIIVCLGYLCAVAWKYAVFFLSALPLLVVYFVAARPELGRFELYYAIPWLLIWFGFFVTAWVRAKKGTLRIRESVVILIAAVGSSSVVFAAFGQESTVRVIKDGIFGDEVDLNSLSDRVAAIVAGRPAVCVSPSVAGLVPNQFRPDQVIDAVHGGQGCRLVLNFSNDMFHGSVKTNAWIADLSLREVLDDRVEVYD